MQLKKRNLLTKKQILEKIDEYSIYRYYLGDFSINKPFNNPLRSDKHPSFRISTDKLGRLSHFDFGSEYFRGNCFDLVMQKFNLDLPKAVDKIASDFGLLSKKIDILWTTPDIIIKKPNRIQVVTKDFSEEEINYWADYKITREELLEDQIFSPKEIYFNRKKWPISDMKFAYKYEDNWKIYSPRAAKGEKWIPNNTHITQIDGVINPCKKLIICKSRKDYRVVKKIHRDTIGVQNESLVAFSDETITKIKNCEEVYLFFDSDAPGKEASHRITKYLGYKHLNTPDYLLSSEIKDPSDWVKASGYQPLIDHLKEKLWT